MAGVSLDVQLQISNAAELKADLTPVFQDIGEGGSPRCSSKIPDPPA